MASLWLGSGSVGRRSKNVSEELRNVVLCGTFGPRTVWAQGGGVRPRFWGRRKTAGGPEDRPVLAADLGQQSKLFLRSVKGTAQKRGLDCGRPFRLSGPFLEAAIGGGWLLLFGSGVAACRGPCVLPFGRPALGLLWDCSGVPWACSGLLWLLWGCSKLPWERLEN